MLKSSKYNILEGILKNLLMQFLLRYKEIITLEGNLIYQVSKSYSEKGFHSRTSEHEHVTLISEFQNDDSRCQPEI